MRKIIYSRADGGVSVVSAPFDTDEAIETARAKLPADAIGPRIVDELAVPADRTFRNAWKQNGFVIEHDMPKARDIQEQRIKDSQRMKIRDILEREVLGENVIAEKASVRALNPRALVDSATSADELKAIFPAILR